MNEELEDLSETTYKYYLWPDDYYIEEEEASFDDWLFDLANLYGGY